MKITKFEIRFLIWKNKMKMKSKNKNKNENGNQNKNGNENKKRISKNITQFPILKAKFF